MSTFPEAERERKQVATNVCDLLEEEDRIRVGILLRRCIRGESFQGAVSDG